MRAPLAVGRPLALALVLALVLRHGDSDARYEQPSGLRQVDVHAVGLDDVAAARLGELDPLVEHAGLAREAVEVPHVDAPDLAGAHVREQLLVGGTALARVGRRDRQVRVDAAGAHLDAVSGRAVAVLLLLAVERELAHALVERDANVDRRVSVSCFSCLVAGFPPHDCITPMVDSDTKSQGIGYIFSFSAM